jgi:hypothetical protein
MFDLFSSYIFEKFPECQCTEPYFTVPPVQTWMMKAVHTSETSVYFRETTWRYIPESWHINNSLFIWQSVTNCICCVASNGRLIQTYVRAVVAYFNVPFWYFYMSGLTETTTNLNHNNLPPGRDSKKGRVCVNHSVSWSWGRLWLSFHAASSALQLTLVPLIWQNSRKQRNHVTGGSISLNTQHTGLSHVCNIPAALIVHADTCTASDPVPGKISQTNGSQCKYWATFCASSTAWRRHDNLGNAQSVCLSVLKAEVHFVKKCKRGDRG